MGTNFGTNCVSFSLANGIPLGRAYCRAHTCADAASLR